MKTMTDSRLDFALRPLFEGANIRTWVGFKHFMYLAEQAVLGWYRERGYGPSALYHDHGLGLTICESAVALPAVLDADDIVTSDVSGGPAKFSVRLAAARPGEPAVLRGRVKVALIREADRGLASVPPELAPLVFSGADAVGLPGRRDRPAGSSSDRAAVLNPDGDGVFGWSWRIPYYYCQYSTRLAHSGYVRAMEETVDRFLADRGLSVATLLRERYWIPVVSRARVTILADAFMEETVHTVLTVTDILRQVSFAAQIDHYVRRGAEFVHTATGTIVHAYAIASGPGAGGLAELDGAVVAALTGRSRAGSERETQAS
jgi:acyl-CoA thioesterase FadM